MSVRTEPRLTRDADLAVVVTDDRDAEALVRDLQGGGWRVVTAIEQEATGRLATVRLALAGDEVAGAVVDLLFASSGIEPEIVAAADTIAAVPGFSVPVARLGHLVALKVLARDDRTRPHDRVDLAARGARCPTMQRAAGGGGRRGEAPDDAWRHVERALISNPGAGRRILGGTLATGPSG